MIVQQIINGLTAGSVYSLIAVGYTLIFGVLGIINMAHGQIFLLGSLCGLMFSLQAGLHPIISLIVSIFVSAILGIVLEFTALRPLRRQKVPHLASLISTIGFAILMEEITHLLFGSDSHSVPGAGIPSFTFMDIMFRGIDIFVIILSIIIMISIRVFLKKTTAGKEIRATAESAEIAQLMGIHTNRIILLTVAISSGLGGLAGFLIGLSYSALSPAMGLTLGFKGLVALIVGGVGSIGGAMISGLLLGLVETLAVTLGASSYKDAVAFALVIIILLVRPGGISGKKHV